MSAVRKKEDGLPLPSDLTFCVEDNRPMLDTTLLEWPSVASAEELGRVLEMAALFEEPPFREVCPFSESACCR